MRKIVFIILICIFCLLFNENITLFANPKILVDCVHGFDVVEELEILFTQFEFEGLTADDFPIDTILFSGTVNPGDSIDTYTFTVPQGIEELYVKLDISWETGIPPAHLVDPNDDYVGIYNGMVEIEDPLPGDWDIGFHIWAIEQSCDFVIGTGPYFFESLNIAEYSAIYRNHSNFRYLFIGSVLEYSDLELQLIEQWVNSGLGFISTYEYIYDFALKPIIRIYDSSKPVDVSISYQGVPTYYSPEPEISSNGNIFNYEWKNLTSDKEYIEILYEVGFTAAPTFLWYDVEDDFIKINNISPNPIYGLYIIKSVDNGHFLIGNIDYLASQNHSSMQFDRISEGEIRKLLNEGLPKKMIERGLPEKDAYEFFKQYRWLDKIIIDLKKNNDFSALYLIDDKAYDGIFPLKFSSNPEEIIRQMLMFEKGISDAPKKQFTELPFEPIELSSKGLKLYEYGFFDINRSRNFKIEIFDINVDDEHYIIDPSNYYYTLEAPIFDTFGDNSISQSLTYNIWEVYNYYAPNVEYNENWSPIILGDDDCYLYGWERSRDLCCMAGRELGIGRILIGGTCVLLDLENYFFDLPSNHTFALNCLNWISEFGGLYLNADFYADVTLGEPPLIVNFTDQSISGIGPIVEWKWYFGDGDSSSVQNPTHIYENPGIYTVSLTITTDNDSIDIEIKEDYITVVETATHISGGIVSDIWVIENSPYSIDGEIQIQIGDTLIIEPGVEVYFSGHYIFYIYGRLLAEGTIEDTITFTAYDTTNGWHGLRFYNTNSNGQDSSKIAYCKFEYAKGTGGTPYSFGGAIYFNHSSDIQIKHCLITKNTALCGSGIFCYYSSPYLSNVIIMGNEANYSGGGIECRNFSNPNLRNVIIKENIAHALCGGIKCSDNSCPTLYNVIISGNHGNYGGGFSCYSSSTPNLNNVIICGNSADCNGGGVYCWEASPNLINVTISNNSAPDNGAGIYLIYSSNPNLLNCIIWNNNPEEIYTYYSSIIAAYSDIQGGWSGIGNIDADPLFINPDIGDYHFLSSSPCIDAGTPDTTGLNLPPFDLDGNPRIYGDRIDMGAYECQGYAVDEWEKPINKTVLYQNYPNPFYPKTIISYSLCKTSNVKIMIYNIKGQLVETLVDAQKPAGYHTVDWNVPKIPASAGTGMSSGIYFYKLRTGDFQEVKKMILLR